MFSVILLGKELGEKGSLYNSLSISAFFIFLIDPMSLYDAGFWLSHLAVLGMGLYYQSIFNLLKFQFVVWRWIWSMVAVSLAAQITTFPIIIWLFNGFPLYFLLANVLIIPLSPIILGGALLLLALPVGSMVSVGVAFVIEYLVVTMDWLVDFVAHLPGSYWRNVSMSALEVALFFIGLLFLTLYMGKHYFAYLKWVIYSVGLMFLSLTIRFLQAEQANDVVSKWSKTKGYVNIISRQSNLVVLSGECRPEDVTAQLIGLWGRRFAENPLFVNCDSMQHDAWRVQIGENQLLWVNRMTGEVEKMIRAGTYKWLIISANDGRLVEELSHSTQAAQLIWIPSIVNSMHLTVSQQDKKVLVVDRTIGSSLYIGN
jgi:competence protein ComEC